MCYDCGCHLPHNPMGKKPVREGGPSLVEEDMEVWAKEEGMTLADVKSNLNEQMGCGCDYPAPTKKASKVFLSEEKLKFMAEGWQMDVHEIKRNICDLLCSTQK